MFAREFLVLVGLEVLGTILVSEKMERYVVLGTGENPLHIDWE